MIGNPRDAKENPEVDSGFDRRLAGWRSCNAGSVAQYNGGQVQ